MKESPERNEERKLRLRVRDRDESETRETREILLLTYDVEDYLTYYITITLLLLN